MFAALYLDIYPFDVIVQNSLEHYTEYNFVHYFTNVSLYCPQYLFRFSNVLVQQYIYSRIPLLKTAAKNIVRWSSLKMRALQDYAVISSKRKDIQRILLNHVALVLTKLSALY